MPLFEPRAVALERDGGFVQPENLRGELKCWAGPLRARP